MANQDKFAETNPKQLEELDEIISGKRKNLEDSQTELKNLQAKLKEITASMSNQQYENEITQLKALNLAAQHALNAYVTGGVKQVTEEEVEEVKSDYTKY